MSRTGLGQAYQVKARSPGLHLVFGKWTGGGAAADMTVTAGDRSDGIASVAYNAATGKYLVTFTEVGQQLIHADAKVHRPTTGDDPLPVNFQMDSYDATAMTIEMEVGASLTDVDTDETVSFFFVFGRVKPNG